MKQKDTFLMPDYYPEFVCKMGKCRSACCENWPVTISMRDYFAVLSLDCDSELKSHIDCGVHILKYATPERYAEITHRYDGQCHMRMADGRCAIQATMGEDDLPEVCRLYPRSIKTDGAFECCCAASCERVVEILMTGRHFNVISSMVEYIPLQNSSREVTDEGMQKQQYMLDIVNKITCTSEPLSRRFCTLLHEVSADIDTASALDAVADLLHSLAENNDSITAFAERALSQLGQKDCILKYSVLSSEFDAIFKDWQIWFANLLANHVFFMRYTANDAEALLASYAVLRVLSVSLVRTFKSIEDLVDLIAAAYRVIEHTDFDRFTLSFLHSRGISDLAPLAYL